jgi:hypothetical protein
MAKYIQDKNCREFWQASPSAQERSQLKAMGYNKLWIFRPCSGIEHTKGDRGEMDIRKSEPHMKKAGE